MKSYTTYTNLASPEWAPCPKRLTTCVRPYLQQAQAAGLYLIQKRMREGLDDGHLALEIE